MASHDTFGPNGVSLNRREVLTLTGAASAVAIHERGFRGGRAPAAYRHG